MKSSNYQKECFHFYFLIKHFVQIAVISELYNTIPLSMFLFSYNYFYYLKSCHYISHNYFNYFNRHFSLPDRKYSIRCIKNSHVLSTIYKTTALIYKIKAIIALQRFFLNKNQINLHSVLTKLKMYISRDISHFFFKC